MATDLKIRIGTARDSMLNRKSLPGEFWIKIILVLLISFACTAAFISISKRIGRLSTVPTFDDCDYTNRGMFYLYDLKHDGLGAMLRHMGEQRIHSPIAEFQAILAYQLLGVNDDASPYWLNVFRILLYVGAIAWFMRSVPIAPWLLAVILAVSVPVAKMTVVEYRPDLFWAICLSLAAFLVVTEERLFTTRRVPIMAGFFFALAFLAKPATFLMTSVVLFISVLARIFHARLFHARSLSWASIRKLIIWIGGPIVILAGWYYVLFGNYIWQYFYINTFGSQGRMWALDGDLATQLSYYISGFGAQNDMGYTGALITVLVIALMSWRLAVGPKEARVRGALLLGLLMMIFLINTYGKLKQPYVGAGIYTTLIFLFAWLLGEFYAVYHKRGFWVGWVLFIFAWTAVYLREWPLDSYRTFLISEHDRKVVASKVGLLGKPGAECVQQAMVNYAKPPTDALIEELSQMRPCPPNILFVEPGPIPPPAISMWMLRRQIRPQFDCSYNVTNLEEFEAYKKRNDLIVVPTVDAPGFNRFQLVSFLLPKIIENLQNDRNFRLLRTAPVTGAKGAVYFFQKI